MSYIASVSINYNPCSFLVLQDYGEESEGLNIVQGYVKPEWVNFWFYFVRSGLYKFWKPLEQIMSWAFLGCLLSVATGYVKRNLYN